LVQHQEKITPLENPALSEIRIYLIFGISFDRLKGLGGFNGGSLIVIGMGIGVMTRRYSGNPAIVRNAMCIRANGLNKPGLLILPHRFILLTNTGEKPGFISC